MARGKGKNKKTKKKKKGPKPRKQSRLSKVMGNAPDPKKRGSKLRGL
jgi:hypothetical protein